MENLFDGFLNDEFFADDKGKNTHQSKYSYEVGLEVFII